MGFHPFRVCHRDENSSAASASHKQENAPGRNRTMHSVSYIQSVHLGTGNTNRDPGVSIVTVRRHDADRGPLEHLAMHSEPAPFIYSRAPITSVGRFSPRATSGGYIIRKYQNIATRK